MPSPTSAAESYENERRHQGAAEDSIPPAELGFAGGDFGISEVVRREDKKAGVQGAFDFAPLIRVPGRHQALDGPKALTMAEQRPDDRGQDSR